jgi:hypothetical protein
MPVKTFDTDKFKEPTGRSFADWLKFAQRENFAELPHDEIAIRLSKAGVPDWWCQMLTVAYEQHIGRRLPGQVGEFFRTQANRTVEGEVADIHARWIKLRAKAKSFDGVALEKTPTTSVTPKRSYWRINLSDGTKVQVAFEPKAGPKTMINVTHDKLDSPDAIERWKAFWKLELSRFN